MEVETLNAPALLKQPGAWPTGGNPVDDNNDIPCGYCHCGCGVKTGIAPHNDRWAGHVSGEPYRDAWEAAGVTYGECLCGCGRPTKVADRTNIRIGHVAGEPVKFIRGHANRKREHYVEEDRGHGTPCWVWQLSKTSEGYAHWSRKGHTLTAAHRIYWEQANGRPVPAGLQLDHLCRQRDCVNPDHLEPVTNAENVRRTPATKLDWPKVRAIRAALADGCDRSELAQVYGVSRSTINAIACGQNWPPDHDPEE